MPNLIVVIILTLVLTLGCIALVRVIPLLAHVQARRRRAARIAAPARRVHQPPVPAAPTVPRGPADVAAVPAPEPVARAFPMQGVPLSREAAAGLEGMLRGMAGVTGAYVSPVTALAYLDYLPARVTAEQLAAAIRDEGYQVGDPSHWFDWRHGPTS